MSTHLRAQIFDSFKNPPVMQDLVVDFADGSPSRVKYQGKNYFATGKTGTHRYSGIATREMAAQDGETLWISLGGVVVWMGEGIGDVRQHL